MDKITPFCRVQKESREDYLEAIYLLTEQNSKPVRYVRLAEYMGFKKPSICRAIGILKEEGAVRMDDDYAVILTAAGIAEARRIYEKHCFFEKQLLAAGVDHETARREACQIEHIISDSSFEKLRNAVRFTKVVYDKEEIEA